MTGAGLEGDALDWYAKPWEAAPQQRPYLWRERKEEHYNIKAYEDIDNSRDCGYYSHFMRR